MAELSKRINISTGGVKRNEAEGVLKVRLTGRNPVEDELLLKRPEQHLPPGGAASSVGGALRRP